VNNSTAVIKLPPTHSVCLQPAGDSAKPGAQEMRVCNITFSVLFLFLPVAAGTSNRASVKCLDGVSKGDHFATIYNSFLIYTDLGLPNGKPRLVSS
jgi:hypothetical protein